MFPLPDESFRKFHHIWLTDIRDILFQNATDDEWYQTIAILIYVLHLSFWLRWAKKAAEDATPNPSIFLYRKSNLEAIKMIWLV